MRVRTLVLGAFCGLAAPLADAFAAPPALGLIPTRAGVSGAVRPTILPLPVGTECRWGQNGFSDVIAPVSMRGFAPATSTEQQASGQSARVLEEAEALDSLDEKTRFMVDIGCSNLAKKHFARDESATYAIHWVRRGSKFEIDSHMTTSARVRALRTARGDEKTFSSESQRYKVNAEGKGPIATAARNRKEVILDDTSTMVRAKLAQEFSIKQSKISVTSQNYPPSSLSLPTCGAPGVQTRVWIPWP